MMTLPAHTAAPAAIDRRRPDPRAGRYERRQILGRGRAGIVHAGIDRLLGRPVAIKTLHDPGAGHRYWLKREFRSLAEFSHPNFAELYDLVVSEGDCFFTMEQVDGRHFLARFRAAGAPPHIDCAGLRAALVQLAGALAALHAQQKLHRDIKPQNVLIDRTDRVVILDYDLVLDARAGAAGVGELAGTPIYMAPEQLMGEPLTPAADWYAVGAMAFEVLTGEVPFAGARRRHALDGSWHVPRARELAPDTPADLDELVARLLHPSAAERGGAAEVLSLLATAAPAPAQHSARADAPAGLRLVSMPPVAGRARELATLQAVFEDDAHARTVSIDGPAGIGKTTLVEHFLRGLEAQPDVLVLRGRSHPREAVPFKAVDAAVDELHHFIAHQPDARRDELLGAGDAVLVRLFPVFADLYGDAAAHDAASPELRARAFAALRALLGRVAEQVRVVLWLDDLHWSDPDSVALLRALRREPRPPRLLTILSFRGNEPGTGDVLAGVREAQWGLEAEQRAVTITLGPVSATDARAIASAALADEATAGDMVDAVTAAAAGNPLLLVELSHHARQVRRSGARPGSLEEIVADHLQRLEPEAREVLELLAISSGPVPEELIFQAGPADRLLRAIARLRTDLLVRRVTREHAPALDVYHSRVRDAVLSGLDPEHSRALHRRMIALLQRAALDDPMLLVHHHSGAGDTAGAAELALAAGRRLAEALAPNAAAAMYRTALELGARGCPRWELEARLGTSLIHAGHGAEGATWLDRAAATLLASEPDALEASRLRRAAAEHYLRSGHHQAGLAMLREVLRARRIAYPPSTVAALGSLLVNRARLAVEERLRPRPAVPPPASEADREVLETLWSAGVGLSLFDGIRAGDFNARHARWARRLNDVGHLARATASQGLILAWEGGRKRHLRSQARLALGRSLAHESGDPHVLAHAMLMEAASAYMEARWADTVPLAAEVEALCTTRCQGAAWELANAHVMTSNALACLGAARRLREHLPRILRSASERGDQYLLVTGRLGHGSYVWLMSDRPDAARRHAEEALAGPFPPGYAWQVYQGALAIAQTDLYVGAPAAGWEHIRSAEPIIRAQHLMRFMPTRVEMLDLRARCALALARQADGLSRRRLLRFVSRAARRIAAEDADWVVPFARLLEAGVASIAGRRESAAQLYSAAADGFVAFGMRMHAWSARARAAELGAPATGPEHGWPAEEGIVAPDTLSRVFAP